MLCCSLRSVYSKLARVAEWVSDLCLGRLRWQAASCAERFLATYRCIVRNVLPQQIRHSLLCSETLFTRALCTITTKSRIGLRNLPTTRCRVHCISKSSLLPVCVNGSINHDFTDGGLCGIQLHLANKFQSQNAVSRVKILARKVPNEQAAAAAAAAAHSSSHVGPAGLHRGRPGSAA